MAVNKKAKQKAKSKLGRTAPTAEARKKPARARDAGKKKARPKPSQAKEVPPTTKAAGPVRSSAHVDGPKKMAGKGPPRDTGKKKKDKKNASPRLRVVAPTLESAEPETAGPESAEPESAHLEGAEHEGTETSRADLESQHLDGVPFERSPPDGTRAPADAETEAFDEALVDTESYLKGLIEAVLFVAERPVELKELARTVKLDQKRTLQILAHLAEDYRGRGVGIHEVAGGFVFRTSPGFSQYVQKFLELRPVRLSRAQIETLAIIAYRQPITRPEIDEIRGVDCGPVLRGLLERELVRILGKKDEAGRPLLYGTTPAFLELFSLGSLRELPTLHEFTELSEESKQLFSRKTGESAPEGLDESDQEAQASDLNAVEPEAFDAVDDADALEEQPDARELAEAIEETEAITEVLHPGGS